jgi:DNA-binding XRE family transcriptional regulator
MGLASRVSYYNLESGIVEPRISQMIILSEILDKPVSHLFNLENK